MLSGLTFIWHLLFQQIAPLFYANLNATSHGFSPGVSGFLYPFQRKWACKVFAFILGLLLQSEPFKQLCSE